MSKKVFTCYFSARTSNNQRVHQSTDIPDQNVLTNSENIRKSPTLYEQIPFDMHIFLHNCHKASFFHHVIDPRHFSNLPKTSLRRKNGCLWKAILLSHIAAVFPGIFSFLTCALGFQTPSLKQMGANITKIAYTILYLRVFNHRNWGQPLNLMVVEAVFSSAYGDLFSWQLHLTKRFFSGTPGPRFFLWPKILAKNL